jgi:molecular chaperone DnaK
MSTFGIDFGTTNSAAVKLIEHGDPQKYGDEAGAPFPSIVAIDRATGEAIAGRSVWENREKYSESGNFIVVQSVKTLLAKDEVWTTEEGPWNPTDVASFVLKQLSRRAETLGLEPIRKAAITIPVDFPARSRLALRTAAEQAGIAVSTFITESTAAFVRYLPQLRHCRYVAVFDWGGGTLDVSILEIRDKTVSELSTEVMEIAGDEIDKDLATAIHRRVMESRGKSIPIDSMSAVDRDNLRTKCERAKCQLSDLSETDVLLASYDGAPLRFTVQRDWFESLIGPHVDLAIEVLSKAIQKARLSFDAVDRILVLGGSSKLRLLHARLRDDLRLSASLQFSADAEWDVATGAAIVEQSPGAYEIAESIGVLLSDNSFYEIVQFGERIHSAPRQIRLSLVEDARQANIVLAKRGSGNRNGTIEPFLAFGVDTLGFNLEALELSYMINRDLIFRAWAESATLRSSRLVQHEFGKLRFTYHL